MKQLRKSRLLAYLIVILLCLVPAAAAGSSVPVKSAVGQSSLIAAGSSHSLQVINGYLWSWGDNSSGQLGNGTFAGRLSPQRVITAEGYPLGHVVSVSAGHAHTLALLANGTVMAWGENRDAQLGDGSTVNSPWPVAVKGPEGEGVLDGVTAVYAGFAYSVAIRENGTVWVWGNHLGEPGDGNEIAFPTEAPGPNSAERLHDIVAVTGGVNHILALKSDGTVWSWGKNRYGQLGVGSISDDTQSPLQVAGIGGEGKLTGVVAIASGLFHNLALLEDGTLCAWGIGTNGQLGVKSGTIPYPVVVMPEFTGSEKLTTIAAGWFHCLALDDSGILWAWGDNRDGQLGTSGHGYYNPTPQKSLLHIIPKVIAIAGSAGHSLALTEQGTRAWGDNRYGQLGDGTVESSNLPVWVKLPAFEVPIAVTGVRLSAASLTLQADAAAVQLTAVVSPQNATNQNVFWYSENKLIASVQDGLITPHAPGSTRIVAATQDGGFRDVCTVTVLAVPVSGVTLDQRSLKLTAGGESVRLTASVQPYNATDSHVTWHSSNESVALVIDGTVIPLSVGSTTISAITRDGGFRAECSVRVQPAKSQKGKK